MTAPSPDPDPVSAGEAAALRAQRWERVRAAMASGDIDVLLVSLGADLPWLTGYEAMPLERLTMLVLPADGEATLAVPRLEAPRVTSGDGLFRILPWDESEDPLDIVAGLVGSSRDVTVAVSERTWSRFVIGLQRRLDRARWRLASEVTGPLRAVKDAAEVSALTSAARAADRVAGALVSGEIPLVGRTEAAVSADISGRLLAEGHDRVNFAIVGSGPNGASPHHTAGARAIEKGDPVVCDFGGTYIAAHERACGSSAGYCSDITRTVVAGHVPEGFAEMYQVLAEAQATARAAAAVGTAFEDVDAAARGIIEAAGFGYAFIHRTGHGIGIEEHEDPYVVEGNRGPIVAGNTFSVEPGIYLSGRFGARIEDIVLATDRGPVALNSVTRELTVVDA